MEYKGMNLCDFCFSPVMPGVVCENCSLTYDTYHAEAGLLLPGTNLLGKYIIGRVLGRGGFGATYLAYSSDREEAVAIKEYYPAGITTRAKGEEKITVISADKKKVFEKGVNRFFEEAKTMSRFNTNKNVVSVYEFFYTNETAYYSMEYLDGIDLKGYISRKGGRISEAEAAIVMKGICEALIAVHSTQTLHRDISPDNIFICTSGDVKLIDFGAAKQVVSDEQQAYSVVVKHGFAPAEQYKAAGKQGVWTDIYAVGASIYYAVTGKTPTDAMSRIENPEIKFDDAPELSPQFVEILGKCLNVKPEERYQSAIELMGALNGLNIPDVVIGGKEYVQDVYNGVNTHLPGGVVSFDGPGTVGVNMQTGYNPWNGGNSAYTNSQRNMSHYSQNGYGQSQYGYSQSGYGYSKNYGYNQQNGYSENSGIIKGLIIGIASVTIIVLLVVLIVTLVQPGGPGMPPPGGPGMPPPGGPGMMPPQNGAGTGLIIGCGATIVAMIATIAGTLIYFKRK